jgi:hypothetical protein
VRLSTGLSAVIVLNEENRGVMRSSACLSIVTSEVIELNEENTEVVRSSAIGCKGQSRNCRKAKS